MLSTVLLSVVLLFLVSLRVNANELHEGAYLCDWERVKEAIDHGFDVNSFIAGSIPLHSLMKGYLVFNKNGHCEKILELLLENGASPHIENAFRKTPLILPKREV
ncbi:MAG: hypothetical protein GDA46_00260 [Bdellovibrionales bacterium]|nr:hypothetical protein [Bdellovibrionales bacterium]